MIWIKERRGKTIPQDLYYPDYQTDKDRWCRTPLMIWVKYRRGEAIPQDLYYPGYQTDKDYYD